MCSRPYSKLLIRSWAAFALILVIAGAVGFTYDHVRADSDPRAGIGTYAEERVFWEQQITQNGGKMAYREMAERYSHLSVLEAHEFVHVFGDALYRVEGADGLKDCGAAYVWACYHQLMTDAIAFSGISILTSLNESCLELGEKYAVLSCQHGLGHGIVANLGPGNLNKALHLCAALPDMTTGCISAVFMEVMDGNVHDQTEPPPYSEAKRYSPCTEVEDAFKTACYRRLASWWALSIPGSTKIAEIISRNNCLEIAERQFRSDCIIGIGWHMAWINGPHAEERSTTCGIFKDSDDHAACLYGVAFAASINDSWQTNAIEP